MRFIKECECCGHGFEAESDEDVRCGQCCMTCRYDRTQGVWIQGPSCHSKKATMSEPTFDQLATVAVQSSVLKYLSSGEWMKADWGQRFTVPKDFLQKVFDSIDMDHVLCIAVTKLEGKLADALVANMATEIGHDVKQIMCNTVLREELRAVVREKLKAVK